MCHGVKSPPVGWCWSCMCYSLPFPAYILSRAIEKLRKSISEHERTCYGIVLKIIWEKYFSSKGSVENTIVLFHFMFKGYVWVGEQAAGYWIWNLKQNSWWEGHSEFKDGFARNNYTSYFNSQKKQSNLWF